jgi:lysophospholipase L1-like esterase
MSRRNLLASPILALCLLAPARPAPASFQTFIALGDSNVFGETDFTRNPSYGDRGFVAPVADALARLYGGVRPNVINLAIDGETTTSYYTGTGRVSDDSGILFNLNYTQPFLSQHDLFLSRLAAERAAGHTVTTVLFALGTNDLNALITPANLALPFDQQVALVTRALATVQANYTRTLTEIRSLLPSADLILPGTYNPYAALPGSPISAIAPLAVQALNQVVEGEAAAFGGHYADIYTPLLGHEAQYTFILTPPVGSNGHLNDLGYSVVGASVASAAVPEPSSLSMLAAGFVGLLVYRRLVRR